jgi:hypothetical protein
MRDKALALVICAVWLGAPLAPAVSAQADKDPSAAAPPCSRRLPTDLRLSLEACYLFEGVRDGKAADAGPKSRPAVVRGAAPARAGRTGRALTFDGKDDYVAVPNLRLKAFSFAAWVRPGLPAGDLNNRRLFCLTGKDHHCAIQGNTRGGVDLYLDGQEVNDYTWSFVRNVWTHVAVTCDGGTLRIYRNGRLTKADAAVAVPLAGTARLGGPTKGNDPHWHGLMDTAVIYSRALSASEVRRLYAWAFADVAIGVLKPMTPAEGAEIERLIRALDADNYQVREKATQALLKRRGRYLAELIRRSSDKKLSAEARARIQQVLSSGGGGDLANVRRSGVLEDPAFLVDLLEIADPARRGAILERLRSTTGARIGADPVKWRQWVREHAPKAAQPDRPAAGPRRGRERLIRHKS